MKVEKIYNRIFMMEFEKIYASFFIGSFWAGLGLIVPIVLCSMGTTKAILVSIPFFLFGHYLTYEIAKLEKK